MFLSPQSQPAEDEDTTEQPAQVTRFSTKEERMLEFISLFRVHLLNSTGLSGSTIDLSARIINDLVKHSFSGKEEGDLTGKSLVKTFAKLGEENSFLRRRKLSGSYSSKIVIACIRVLEFLGDPATTEPWLVKRETCDESISALKMLLKRYQKSEKQERAVLRASKEKNVLTSVEIKQILQCTSVKNVLETASKSLDDQMLRVTTTKDVTALRDALMTSLLVRSLRRAQEFTEFTLEEWKSRCIQEGEATVVKVKIHKTMAYGSAEFVLDQTEERALQAYIEHGRPTLTRCTSEACPVFTSTHPGPGETCCVKLHLTNVTAIISKIAIKAGVTSRKVNTRMLRRSTISEAWKTKSDPAFRQELSQLAGHSYETARRYYAVYDTSQQSRKVVSELERMRE